MIFINPGNNKLSFFPGLCKYINYSISCILILVFVFGSLPGCSRKKEPPGKQLRKIISAPTVTPFISPRPTATFEKTMEITPSPTPYSIMVIRGLVRWHLDKSPYIIDRDLVIMSDSSLTVDPGVEIRVNKGRKILVLGRLYAIGGLARIKFTSNTENPQPGDWLGFEVRAGGSIILSYCEVEYAENIVCTNSNVQVYHTNFEQFSGTCFLWSRSFGDVQDVNYNDINGYPMEITDISGMPSIGGITVSGKTRNAILVTGGKITSTVKLNSNAISYRIVKSDIIIENNGQLQIEKSVSLKFDSGLGIKVKDKGVLDILGTGTQPVNLESGKETPFPGDWLGIEISSAGKANIESCYIRYSQGIQVKNGTLVLNRSVLEDIEGDGITWNNSIGKLSKLVFKRIIGYPVHVKPPISLPDMEGLHSESVLNNGIFINTKVIENNIKFPKVDLPYTFPGLLVVVKPRTELVFAEGNTIQFQDDGGFKFEQESVLTCVGSSSDQIVFQPEKDITETSYKPYQLVFDKNSTLESRYTSFLSGKRVLVENGIVSLEYCSFKNFAENALTIKNTGGTIRNCYFLNNEGYPIKTFLGFMIPQLEDVSATGNLVDAIYLTTTNLSTRVTLVAPGIPYVVGPGILRIYNTVFQVKPYNKLFFETSAGLYTGNKGKLLLEGNISEPIILSVFSETGYWEGMDCFGGTIVMKGCQVERAKLLQFQDSNLAIDNSKFLDMKLDGLKLSNCSGSITNVLLENNPGIPIICNVDKQIPALANIQAQANLLDMVWLQGNNLLARDIDLVLPPISIPYLLHVNKINNKQTLLKTKQPGTQGYIEYTSIDPRIVKYFYGD